MATAMYRRYLIIITTLLLICSLFPLPSQTVYAQGQVHIVQPGETLFRIALRYGVTVEAIAAINNISDPTRIYAGQVLAIPGQISASVQNQQPVQPQPETQSVNVGPVYYTVQPGDTLNIIARKFGIAWQALVNANGITNPNHIEPGQRLVIPGVAAPAGSATVPDMSASQPIVGPTAVSPTPIPPTAIVQPPAQSNVSTTGVRTHIVKPGEGLAAIGCIYGISWPTIAAANNITDPNTIYAGMVLTIPASDSNPTMMTTSQGVPPGPNPPGDSGKLIVVILREQRVYAYENGQLVRNVLVSIGLPATPTVQGDFKIYVKYTAQLMTGPGYYLPGVPWVMYFYQGYSFHGTYWHNNFGRPMSHGCVNMPTEEALWLFKWAEVGTSVQVRWA